MYVVRMVHNTGIYNIVRTYGNGTQYTLRIYTYVRAVPVQYYTAPPRV